MEKNNKKLTYVVLLVIGFIPCIMSVINGIINARNGYEIMLFPNGVPKGMYPQIISREVKGMEAFINTFINNIITYWYIAIPSIILIFFSVIMLMKNRKK